MLYMRAIAPKAGVLILEKELLKTYPKIAQIHHSRLAQKWHETAELVKKWMQESIDLSFCGARDVVVDVLGKHFSKFM